MATTMKEMDVTRTVLSNQAGPAQEGHLTHQTPAKIFVEMARSLDKRMATVTTATLMTQMDALKHVL